MRELLRKNLSRSLTAALAILVAGPSILSHAAPITIGTTYQDRAVTLCPTVNKQCSLPLTAVPTNKELILTHAACYIQTTLNANYGRLRLVVLNPGGSVIGPNSPLIPTIVGATSNVRYWQLNHPIQQLVKPGHKPQISVELQAANTDIFVVECTITGTISDAPPI